MCENSFIQSKGIVQIVCRALTGETSATSVAEEIYADLSRQEPTIKLLYVTPEKVPFCVACLDRSDLRIGSFAIDFREFA